MLEVKFDLKLKHFNHESKLTLNLLCLLGLGHKEY